MPFITENEIIIACFCFSFTMMIAAMFIGINSPIESLALFFTLFIFSMLGGEAYFKYQSKIKNEIIANVLIINEGFLEENHKIYSEEEALKRGIMSDNSKEVLSNHFAKKYINFDFEGNQLVMNINKVSQSDLTFCKKTISKLQEQFTHSTIMVNGKDINSVVSSDTSLEYQCGKGEKTVIKTMLN